MEHMISFTMPVNLMTEARKVTLTANDQDVGVDLCVLSSISKKTSQTDRYLYMEIRRKNNRLLTPHPVPNHCVINI